MTISANVGFNSGFSAGVRLVSQPVDADLLKRFVAKKELPFGDQEADARWGKPATFNLLDSDISGQPSVTVIWPEDEEEEEEPPPLQYEEEWRAVEEIRIENPDDAEQYVMVERITSIIFRGEDSRRHQFNLHPELSE